MKEINILDSNFAHHKKSSVADHQDNERFIWCRRNELVSDSCFFTDLHLRDVDRVQKPKRKIAWLLEPRAINPGMYQWIVENNRKFDYVLTFDKQLLDLRQNYLFYPFGVSWIRVQPEQYKKTKKFSIIASNKSMTPGHEFRKQVVEHCLKRGDVDVFGRGYNEIESKEQGLDDYMFSIVMENSRADWYFSEKLIDCMLTATVPIYWGCENLHQFFDVDSILNFTSIEGLDNILNVVNEGVYSLLTNSIDTNISRIYDNFLDIPEHWMFKHYPFLFE